MAMIDYGAVVFKNGKHINKGMFMDMLEAVGWVDKPRLRYEDCDHLCLGRSSCEDCPRANYENVNFGYGDVKRFVSDCRERSDGFERGIDGNFFAYIGDEHLTICFYKYFCKILVDGKQFLDIYRCSEEYSSNRVSYRGMIRFGLFGDEVNYHIKRIGDGVYHFSMIYNGDSYHVVYGYGIDPSKKVWDRVKVDYVGKSVAKKVDRIYESLGGLREE